METRKALVEAAGIDAYIKATPTFLYPDWWINRFGDRLAALDEATREAFPTPTIAASRCQAVIDFDRVADLPRIKAPTLVICARDDFLTPAYFSRELAQRIPGAKLMVLEQGGHAVSQVDPAAFDRAVLNFLTPGGTTG